MPWTVTFNPNQQIIEVIYSKKITKAQVEQAHLQRVSTQSETQCDYILINAKSAILPDSFTLFDLFDVPTEMFIKSNSSRKSCMALILPTCEASNEKALFYETACLNRGWNIKSFHDKESAIEWLNYKRDNNSSRSTAPDKIQLVLNKKSLE